MSQFEYEISYGKHQVPVYRVNARALDGIALIPESAFTGRTNTVFAMLVNVEVFGDHFLPAYTEGDNRMVVATDSMKNFVLRQALAYEGTTHEGFLVFLGRGFLETYPEMKTIRVSCEEIPFHAAQVPVETGGVGPSNVLFDRGHDDRSTAMIEMTTRPEGAAITGHRSGRVRMQLLKTTGSSFTSFVRDEFTTLPERRDRPLFIYLDTHWRYTSVEDAVGDDHQGYVPAEQVRDLVRTVFHEFVSESIQHLVHEMGLRMLDRFPQLVEVSFDAQNRTRDPFFESKTDSTVKVYSDPFPAYGGIKLTMRRGAA
jgi:urate oxidase